MEVDNIKKILTAIGNPILNNELKKLNELAVVENDIQYKEGILEILEINNNIDFIIISELLPGEINLIELIEKIKIINNKIKIIIILDNYEDDKNTIIQEKINTGEIYKIFYNNKVELKEIIELFNENEKMQKYNYEIKKEIEELKEIIKNNQINIQKNNYKKNKLIKNNIFILNKKTIKIIKLIKNIIINIYCFFTNNIKKLNNKNNKSFKLINNKNINKNYYEEKLINEKNKIISILGNNCSGKSTFAIILAKLLKEKNNKILIIDFDILNNSLHTMLGVKKYSEKIKNIINNNINNFNEINIENLIIKINKKIDLISGINLIFNSKNKINNNDFKIILNKLFNNYEYVIIDTTSECFFEYIKELINMSNICFFLTEANLSEISKSKRLLEIYSNNWNVDNNKIKILFNKYNKNNIDIELLKKLYFDYEIIGKIKLNNNSDFNNINLLNCKTNIINLLNNKKLKINN